MTRPRVLGALVALAVAILDQASKRWVVDGLGMADRQPFALASFLDLRLSWNRGISFSLFAQEGALGRAALLGLTLAATIFLSLWLWRSRRLAVALGLGGIIGGALGNFYDRLAYGAVADFLDLHWGTKHFFVFNLADAAINLGVALLLLDAFFGGRRESTP